MMRATRGIPAAVSHPGDNLPEYEDTATHGGRLAGTLSGAAAEDPVSDRRAGGFPVRIRLG